MTYGDRDQLLRDDAYLIHPLQHHVDHSEPLVCVRAEGSTLIDIEGNRYIDGLSSLWNVNVGHGRRELASAAADQMAGLGFFSCYAGATNIPAVRLANRLKELAPGSLNYTFFTSGGAVSNDSAIKTARYFWQRAGRPEKTGIISRTHAYHGVTIGAMNATGLEAYWADFATSLPGFVHIDAPYPYHYRPAEPGVGCGEAGARALEEAILREGPETVAAFIGEPVQGAAGVIVPPEDYWARVREICTKYDVLLIADEVITGFGRIGHWFGVSHWGVEPDIIAFAKGVTSGYVPLGGIIVSDEIHDCIENAPEDRKWNHSFTYSGHPTCCAVGLANIDLIAREGLIDRSREMGEALIDGLGSLRSLPHVGDIRGIGLMAAVEVVEDPASRKPYDPAVKTGARIVKKMLENGVYTRCRGDSVNFAPPLVVTSEELERMINVAGEAIESVTS